MHLLAGGKFKRAIFAGNAAEKTLDGTNNGVLRRFSQVPVRCAMDWKRETGWEERVMLGTAILVWPRLAAPNFWGLIDDYWGYVLPHFRGFQLNLEESTSSEIALIES
jgi:hypothetical protein